MQPLLTPNPDRQRNRASWDALAAAHGQDAYYDGARLVAGASSLSAEEDAALGATGCVELAGRQGQRVWEQDVSPLATFRESARGIK